MGAAKFASKRSISALTRERLSRGRHHVNINHGPQLVVIHFSGSIDRADVGNRIERSGLFHASAAQRNLFEVVERLNLRFGILHGEHVVVAGFRIDPVTWCDHSVGTERGDYVIHHFFWAEAQHAGAFAIDIELQAGIIHILRDQERRSLLAKLSLSARASLPDRNRWRDRWCSLEYQTARADPDSRSNPLIRQPGNMCSLAADPARVFAARDSCIRSCRFCGLL